MKNENMIMKLCEKSNNILDDAATVVIRPCENGYRAVINLSSIADKLVYNAGRWCKRYASDMLITWSEVEEKLNKHLSTLDSVDKDVIVFAFRKMGVDSNTYLQTNIEGGVSIDLYYTCIYAVHIMDVINDDDNTKTVYVTLKDITSVAESEAYSHRQ